jgi:hypothetical protein
VDDMYCVYLYFLLFFIKFKWSCASSYFADARYNNKNILLIKHILLRKSVNACSCSSPTLAISSLYEVLHGINGKKISTQLLSTDEDNVSCVHIYCSTLVSQALSSSISEGSLFCCYRLRSRIESKLISKTKKIESKLLA